MFVALNGGHGRSTMLIYCAERNAIVYRTNGAALNPHVDNTNLIVSKIEKLITDGVVEVLGPKQNLRNVTTLNQVIASTQEPKRVAIALPGVGVSEDHPHLRSQLAKLFDGTEHDLLDDTWAGLLAVTGRPYGVCAFSGCGASVCVAANGFEAKRSNKFDGWGPVIGDLGSGFHIVMRFFQETCRAIDRGEKPNLYEAVSRSLKPEKSRTLLPETSKIQSWFDELRNKANTWRPIFASLAEPILRLADEKTGSTESALAKRLIEQPAAELVETIRIATRSRDLREMPLILQGGILRNSVFYQNMVIESLKNDFRAIEVAKHGPVVGALIQASGEPAARIHTAMANLA